MRRRYRAELAIEDRFAWFAAGRLVPAKALDRMIDAFAAVHAAEPRSILLIAGDGPLEDRLHDQVAKLALSDAVGLLGRRDDVPALMNAADGYIMTSLWEGMPMVLLEAAASGLPAVATNVAGNADVVVHGETGFLVPPRDSGALVNAMVRTMRMPVEERAAAALAARSRIRQHFDLRVVADRWEAAYADAARRHADQRR
jgi:glycosyltransferase involved in cell wall biosynthesis